MNYTKKCSDFWPEHFFFWGVFTTPLYINHDNWYKLSCLRTNLFLDFCDPKYDGSIYSSILKISNRLRVALPNGEYGNANFQKGRDTKDSGKYEIRIITRGTKTCLDISS